MERWSHFGKSVTVKQLAKWIEWRTKQAIQAARPVKSPAKPKATPNGKMTPKALSTLKASSSKLVQSSLTPSPSKIATTRKMTPRVEVVIPISARKFASNGSSSLSSLTSNPVANGITLLSENDDASDTSSGLSTPPVSSEEDLLPLLNPKGYKPSISVIEENGKELARRLMEVAEWLEVLEWRGMGEMR